MKKKMLSLMLAGTLCASMPLSVFAAQPTTAPGSSDFTTEGQVNYTDTTVYSVTLPTTGSFNFILDPQGILSATDTTTYPESTAGQIVATEETGAYINNMSSVPIKLMVEAYVQSDAAGAVSTVNLLSGGDVNAGIDNNMMLTFDITHDGLDVATFTDITSIKTENVNQDVIAITQNGLPSAPAKGTQISFALREAAYEFKDAAGTYAPKDGEKGDSVGMRLGGFVNVNADWSAYTAAATNPEKIIVKTIFSFDKLSTDYGLAALDGRAHGVLADIPATYFAGMEYDTDGNLTGNTATGAMDYSVAQGALRIPFNFGTGIYELKVQALDLGGALAATDYKVINNEICIKSTAPTVKTALDAAVEAAAQGQDAPVVPVTITTDDNVTTTVNVTMYP